ncbi:hypothetical protein [Shewanella maritima]|uniref:hypothetical protein n=1 Tax=Shewanella maritima TaxID=2520507 RepID=UPI003735FD8D
MKVETEIVNGVYETGKVHLTIGEDSVTKHFKPCSKYIKRYNIEKESLIRLGNISNIPNLIHSDDDTTTLVMSRLHGNTPTHLNEANLQELIVIVQKMLDAGVARHALPLRDILVDTNNKVSLVDFERATLQGSFLRVDWLIAKKVSHYHLYRLTSQFQPQLLTKKQAFKLNLVTQIRRIFKR